jgi:hypothetical protein
MSARPERPSYSWGDAMTVIVHLSLISGASACRIPTEFCSGALQVTVHFYDATLSDTNGLLGPFTLPCSSYPVAVLPGSGVSVGVAAQFVCGSGNLDCEDSHDGVEQWDGHVEWLLAPGHILGDAPFGVEVVTPPRNAATTTTSTSTLPTTTSTSTTSTSTPSTTTSTG